MDRGILNGADIQELEKTWTNKVLKNRILHRIWKILPGFVVWEIWKERNNRIFEGRTRKPEEVWKVIQTHTIEILGLTKWGDKDIQETKEEKAILQKWEI